MRHGRSRLPYEYRDGSEVLKTISTMDGAKVPNTDSHEFVIPKPKPNLGA